MEKAIVTLIGYSTYTYKGRTRIQGESFEVEGHEVAYWDNMPKECVRVVRLAAPTAPPPPPVTPPAPPDPPFYPTPVQDQQVELPTPGVESGGDIEGYDINPDGETR
jgi:hypothetical protein